MIPSLPAYDRFPRLRQLAVLLGMFLLCGAAQAAPLLRVAAAADLAPCIDALDRAFMQTTGNAEVRSTIGSSGNFFAQIKNGAPFDVLLSADMHYPRALAKAGQADAGTLTVYAQGRLVMWSHQLKIDSGSGLQRLTESDVQRIAIANPDVAPYGRAAKAALEKAGVWQLVRSKIVIGENVAQTAQFVQTSHAQVGLISATQIASAAGASGDHVWEVPANLYPPIEQGAIITAIGRRNPLSAKYLAFLRSAAARAILTRYHFTVPAPHS